MDKSSINKTGEDDDTMTGVYNAWSKYANACVKQ